MCRKPAFLCYLRDIHRHLVVFQIIDLIFYIRGVQRLCITVLHAHKELSGGSLRIHLHSHGTYIPALHGCLIFLPGAAFRLAAAAAPVIQEQHQRRHQKQVGAHSSCSSVQTFFSSLLRIHISMPGPKRGRHVIFPHPAPQRPHKAGYGNAGCNPGHSPRQIYPGSQSSCNPL